MGIFKSKRLFDAPISFIEYIKDDIEKEMRFEEYKVQSQKLASGGYDISIAKGNLIKSVLGLKTGLKLQINPLGNSISVEAGIGIFGQQVIPTAIMLFIFWPVIITQIWGIVKQQKLDDRIIEIANNCILRHLAASASNAKSEDDKFCPKCGKRCGVNAHFCVDCGEKL